MSWDDLYDKQSATLLNQPKHICLDERIYYPTDLPLSGSHRPLWPVFGEYKYLPPQRWVHALEHGGIALLYHPCLKMSPELAALKHLARDCLGKHMISPYRKIPFNMPYALLAYKHARLIGRFEPTSEHDVNFILDFIKEHGAVALLYHPCLKMSPELAALKHLVRDCLGKHVISPYRKIPFNMPFALLAYKHARLIGRFEPTSEHDVNFILDFIKRYALEGPETHVLDNGQYSVGLVRNATDFSDLQEDKASLCSFLK